MTSTRRSRRGSILIVTLAVFLGLVLIFAFFSLGFVRTVGAHQEQETAIEAAALAAAKALSKIVIDDPELGFVSLSNCPPACKNTTAGDNYYTPVNSINRLLATHRVDSIIISYLTREMGTSRALYDACLQRDYVHIRAAHDRLKAELAQSIEADSGGKDADGNFISPLDEARKAYEQNCIRMTGEKNTLLPGTLKLSLGISPDIVTNTAAPDDNTTTPEGCFFDHCYVAYRDIPLGSRHYVFCGTGEEACLVSVKKFQSGGNGLPFCLPCIVRAEGVQEFRSADGHAKKVLAAACAQPPCLNDNCPNPGSLTLSFPNGPPAEIHALEEVLYSRQIAHCPADLVESPRGGDYPQTAMSKFILPEIGEENPLMAKVLKIAFYDWLKRGRETVKVHGFSVSLERDSVSDWPTYANLVRPTVKRGFDWFALPAYAGNGGTGGTEPVVIPPEFPKHNPLTHEHDPRRVTYKYENGKIKAYSRPYDGKPDFSVSHNQWRCVSGAAFKSSSGKYYDVVIKDNCYQPGRSQGGVHAGEPLTYSSTSSGGIVEQRRIDDVTKIDNHFPQGGSGGEPRPGYYAEGVAVDIRISEVNALKP